MLWRVLFGPGRERLPRINFAFRSNLNLYFHRPNARSKLGSCLAATGQHSPLRLLTVRYTSLCLHHDRTRSDQQLLMWTRSNISTRLHVIAMHLQSRRRRKGPVDMDRYRTLGDILDSGTHLKAALLRYPSHLGASHQRPSPLRK